MVGWNDFFLHPWAVWLAIAVLCAILELLVPSLAFMFASFGALTAAVASPYVGWLAQTFVFAFGLLTTLLLLRPAFLRHARQAPRRHFHSRADVLLGRRGLVTETIDSSVNSGRVLVEGEDWAARADAVITAGQNIQVDSTDGIVLVVKEI